MGATITSQITRACLDATSLAELATRALPHLARALGLSIASAFEETAALRLTGYAAPEMPELIAEYGARYVRSDPMRLVKQETAGPLVIPSRSVDRKALRQSAVYEDFFRPWRMEHLAILRLHQDEDRVLGLALWRAPRRGDFSAGDLRTVRRLLPLFIAAGGRAARFEALSDRLNLLQALLESPASLPRLVVDRTGKIVWVSASARRSFSEVVDALNNPRHPVCELARRLHADNAELSPEDAHPQFLLSSGANLTIDVCRLPGAGELALISLHGEEPFQAWARGKHLTPGEAAVLHRLCSGKSNEEIGRDLFISPETVRTHLTRIFKKLGVSSRLQAVLEVPTVVDASRSRQH